MKKYILDKVLVFICLVGNAIMLLLLCDGASVTIILCIISVVVYSCLCWRVLALFLDVLCGSKGKVVQTVYSSGFVWAWEGDVFTKKYCYQWKFRYGSKQKIILWVPASVTKEEYELIEHPKPDARVKITYYRLSKILISWEPV